MSQAVECLRRKSVSELLAADSLLLTSFNASNGLAKTPPSPSPSSTGSSLRFPIDNLFSSSPFNGTKSTIQAIDSSKVVLQQQRHPSHRSQESSASSSATSDLRSDSYPSGTVNVMSNNPGNKSKGAISQSSPNSGSDQTTTTARSDYTTALVVVVLGLVFLVFNILLLVREYVKREKSPPAAKTERSPKTQPGTPFSGESSPTSNQVRFQRQL